MRHFVKRKKRQARRICFVVKCYEFQVLAGLLCPGGIPDPQVDLKIH